MMQIGEQGIRLNLMQKSDMNELYGDGRLHKMNQTPTVLDIQENVGFRLQVESSGVKLTVAKRLKL